LQVFRLKWLKKFSFKKPTDVGGCMGRRLPPSVGNDGWLSAVAHVMAFGGKKLINFETIVYFCKMNKKYK
jgi:hypothetical protein